MIALAMFFGYARISGAAAGDLLMESGTDAHKTLATGGSWDLGYEGYVRTVRQMDIVSRQINFQTLL